MAEKPEDLNLPASVVTRIMKEAIPDGVAVSKEARQAISKAASVFVLYCTACANSHATKVKRKTLLGADVLAAMGDMEFEHFVPDLKDSLAAFRKDQQEKKETAAERRKAAQAAAVGTGSTSGEADSAATNGQGAGTVSPAGENGMGADGRADEDGNPDEV
ncbi:DNA polymerase epsilon subunit 3-like [Sycon ciliatum]|uniref:DNA polymerase epsilon subunit 3-like n=1 Tax=Sycon ciliatum TaxID=27933 RepID=UPI0020AB3814|eukprot:scpid73688/ scgid10343/ DNA polymerase epsilon subunit 3; Arsenic-transactivated protein; Chromatin accessibility complex 17 kDa protein; DNA polymerase II subunit 3; DNA polymerase epsilon subunit p17 &gt; DNA polymerase epsilon subunit 3; DNA polymerase II subunit 3; DNA polymerase epsilon subunit p17 &gt; DNA polymerase epsilon subunit 3; DNA polymerase II subunit 3